MLLPDRLNQRIAEAITHQINTEREQADTASPVWRERCEVARVAMFNDAERSVFISHISERRGSAAAREMQSQAESLRTNAIFFLARKCNEHLPQIVNTVSKWNDFGTSPKRRRMTLSLDDGVQNATDTGRR